MKIEEAIASLEGRLSKMDNWEYREPVRLLIDAYNGQAMILAEAGPKLLSEMQLAADWQAVATRTIQLLKQRKAPGMDAAIEEFLSKMQATGEFTL